MANTPEGRALKAAKGYIDSKLAPDAPLSVKKVKVELSGGELQVRATSRRADDLYAYHDAIINALGEIGVEAGRNFSSGSGRMPPTLLGHEGNDSMMSITPINLRANGGGDAVAEKLNSAVQALGDDPKKQGASFVERFVHRRENKAEERDLVRAARDFVKTTLQPIEGVKGVRVDHHTVGTLTIRAEGKSGEGVRKQQEITVKALEGIGVLKPERVRLNDFVWVDASKNGGFKELTRKLDEATAKATGVAPRGSFQDRLANEQKSDGLEKARW